MKPDTDIYTELKIPSSVVYKSITFMSIRLNKFPLCNRYKTTSESFIIFKISLFTIKLTISDINNVRLYIPIKTYIFLLFLS